MLRPKISLAHATPPCPLKLHHDYLAIVIFHILHRHFRRHEHRHDDARLDAIAFCREMALGSLAIIVINNNISASHDD